MSASLPAFKVNNVVESDEDKENEPADSKPYIRRLDEEPEEPLLKEKVQKSKPVIEEVTPEATELG